MNDDILENIYKMSHICSVIEKYMKRKPSDSNDVEVKMEYISTLIRNMIHSIEKFENQIGHKSYKSMVQITHTQLKMLSKDIELWQKGIPPEFLQEILKHNEKLAGQGD